MAREQMVPAYTEGMSSTPNFRGGDKAEKESNLAEACENSPAPASVGTSELLLSILHSTAYTFKMKAFLLRFALHCRRCNPITSISET